MEADTESGALHTGSGAAPRRSLREGVVLDGASGAPLAEAEIVELESSLGDAVAAVTHSGFGYKEANEDRIAMIETADDAGSTASLFVVDGMGGHHSGDLCAQALSEELLRTAGVPAGELDARCRELLLEKILELVFRMPSEDLVQRIVAALDRQFTGIDPATTVEELYHDAVEVVQVEAIHVDPPRPEVLQRVAEVVHRVMGVSLPDRTELAVRSARRRIDRLGYREKPPDACFVGAVVRSGSDGLRTLDIKQVGDCKLVLRSADGRLRFQSIGESVIAEPDLGDPEISLAQLMTYSLHRNFVSNSMNVSPLNTKRYRRSEVPLALAPGDVVYLYSDGCDDLFTPAELVAMDRAGSGVSFVRTLLEWSDRRMRFVNALLRAEQARRRPAEMRLAYPAVHQRMNEQRLVQGRYVERYEDGSSGEWMKPPKCDNFAFIRLEIGGAGGG